MGGWSHISKPAPTSILNQGKILSLTGAANQSLPLLTTEPIYYTQNRVCSGSPKTTNDSLSWRAHKCKQQTWEHWGCSYNRMHGRCTYRPILFGMGHASNLFHIDPMCIFLFFLNLGKEASMIFSLNIQQFKVFQCPHVDGQVECTTFLWLRIFGRLQRDNQQLRRNFWPWTWTTSS